MLSHAGWQTHALSDGKGLRKIDPKLAPISTAVGVLGMPGMTAYTGLLEIGKPQAGETVVVAAASGAVGSAVGQIAKIKGARAVGIVGGKDKCAYVKNELGFDECPRPSRSQPCREAEGGLSGGHRRLFRECWRRGGRGGVSAAQRVRAHPGVCGLIAHYNDHPRRMRRNGRSAMMRNILTKRLTFRGFIVSDFAAMHGDFLRDMSQWVREGKVKYKEFVTEGLDSAPEAFIGPAQGRQFRQAAGPGWAGQGLSRGLFKVLFRAATYQKRHNRRHLGQFCRAICSTGARRN